MAQPTMTQCFKKAADKKGNEDPNLQQSDPSNNDDASDQPQHLNYVTPRFLRRVTHPSEEESPSEGGVTSSQSTMMEAPQSQNDEEEEEFDETAVNLTQDELEIFTQKEWNIFEDEDDDEDIPSDEPERIDFTQTQPDEIEEQSNLQRGPKRVRHEESQISSVIHKVKADTEDEWHLDVDNTWKIFRKNEKFTIGPQVDSLHPDVVYTIYDFFNDPKVGKMARCHVSILAQKTFIGKGNKNFSAKAFEDKFQSKYVGLRYSEAKPLRKLQFITNTSGIRNPTLFFDPPIGKSKGRGWTTAFSFSKNFGVHDKCYILQTPNALDGCAGGGGMSYALDTNGFKVTHAVDYDATAVSTLKLNHKSGETRVFYQDINEFHKDVKKAHETNNPYAPPRPENDPYKLRDIVLQIHFSPPCQGFSAMNTTGCEENKEKNNKVSLTFPALVIETNCITATFENVTGMLHDDRIHYVKEIMYELIMNDYQVRVGILDSSEFGDPQKRQRVVMFVSKKGYILPDMPEPTHGSSPPLKPFRTPKDAIGDLEKVAPKLTPGIVVLPSGIEVDHHVRSHDLKNPEEHAKTDTLVADKPANTVLCSHAIKHYKFNRACTNLEHARLQSFPDTWKFAGSPKEVQKQIGNAVPIGLATAIAKAVFSVYEVDPGYLDDSPPDVLG